MSRSTRQTISQECGSYHIISKVTKGTPLFSEEEKEHFFALMSRLAEGFFIRIISYCIMGNHFHILATGMDLEAKEASAEELLKRYRRIFGEDAEPPVGSYSSNGEIIPDEDGGIERLRERLGKMSRFAQELKQGFSRWYNKKHERQGHLWAERYKGVLVYHGIAELVCSSYIDLNPVRAGIVKSPEDYKWSSLSLRDQSPTQASTLLFPINPVDAFDFSDHDGEITYPRVIEGMYELDWYRAFVYVSGGIERDGKSHIPESIVESVLSVSDYLKVTGELKHRVANISKGQAIGFSMPIMKLQQKENRTKISPRFFIDSSWAGTTRVMRN